MNLKQEREKLSRDLLNGWSERGTHWWRPSGHRRWHFLHRHCHRKYLQPTTGGPSIFFWIFNFIACVYYLLIFNFDFGLMHVLTCTIKTYFKLQKFIGFFCTIKPYTHGWMSLRFNLGLIKLLYGVYFFFLHSLIFVLPNLPEL